MFDLAIDTARFGNIRGFTSIREAYARVTGTADPWAGLTDQSQLGNIRVSESAPIARITEADTTTASFSYLLGTSMNKRLLKDYQAWPAEWQKFVTIVPIRDFKQQTRVRLGAFGSLPIVAEDTAYQAVTLQDSAATYVPQKRGNLVTVSRETIINDDLQAIKQIPTKLAVAAAYTLAEFVYAFLSTNPTIYDGSALFTNGNPHNNLGSSALSTAAMQTGITAMREQTNFAGKRLGLRPRYLVVPPELEWVAMVATKSAGAPGGNNNDINPLLGFVSVIVSPQLTSTTQWFMAADPREIDTIEIGFVGGVINPSLFVQDQPLFGLNFSQDVISYKCRHEYGGAITDFRGIWRGI
jgi:phage major head subunit gpT-like protein